MPTAPTVPRRAATAVAALVAGVVALGSCGGTGVEAAPTPAGSAPAPASASWDDGVVVATSGAQVRGRLDLVPGTAAVAVELAHGFPASIPAACTPSNVKRLQSFIVGSTLVCRLAREVDDLLFTAVVDAPGGSMLGGTVTTESTAGERATTSLPRRLVAGGPRVEPDVRLVSSPDFLNADVADLAVGPSRWKPDRSPNGTSPAYERAIGGILDDWKSLDPDAVLVAGDLVNGRWGFDDRRTGNFGPVGTVAQRRAAYRRAARTYYPQWQRRFDERGLLVFPSVGDHEYGDNPFSPGKRALVGTVRREFARQFTLNPDGSPRYTDRPKGPARLTAFAGRPHPDLQIVSLDVFDITRKRARIRIDRQQMRWLRGVLERAQRDGVRWIVVESHVPIAYPVRNRASSALHYEGGTDSALWQVLRSHGVDLYLSGEVHDTQLVARDGIVQVSHGGAFQYGLTTALVLDVHGEHLSLTLRDYDVTKRRSGDRLWETRRAGLPAGISLQGPPRVIGTASLGPDGLVDASGILTPVG
jgi:hypothetical protein